MIRRRIQLAAPPERARTLFREPEAWPRWMPGVHRVRVLRRHRGFLLLDVEQSCFGYHFTQRLESREEGDAVRHRQVGGWLKSWRADWALREGGEGTELAVAVEFELGLVGLLSPRFVVERWMRGQVERTLEQASKHLQRRRRTGAGARRPAE